MKMFQYLNLCANKPRLLQFLRQKSILHSEILCTKCHRQMDFCESSNAYICRRARRVEDSHRRMVWDQCNTRVSVYHKSCFEGMRLDITKVFQCIGWWMFLEGSRFDIIQGELGLSNGTLSKLIKFIHDCLFVWRGNNFEKIGGFGKIVEIDETMIKSTKYRRGKKGPGKWVVGGKERGSERIFMTAVPDRSKHTLLKVIQDHVLPGTIIMTDCWSGYTGLKTRGYYHLQVNHSQCFVVTGELNLKVHTQNIERLWRDLKSFLPHYGLRMNRIDAYVNEFIFRKMVNREDRYDQFVESMPRIS